MFPVGSNKTNNLTKETVIRYMSETTSDMTLLPNTAKEAEKSLDL